MLLPQGSENREHLERRGYLASERTYVERQLAGAVAAPTALEGVGGRMIDVGLWDDLKGMEEAKQINPAFLRPGRFNYILPIGPPDEDARAALWERYVEDISDQDVDVDVVALVRATELFTPADIEFAARQAAHQAFERAHFQGADHGATMQDFLAAVDGTTPTLTEEIVDRFQEDAEEVHAPLRLATVEGTGGSRAEGHTRRHLAARAFVVAGGLLARRSG